MFQLSPRTEVLRNNLKSQPHPPHAKATSKTVLSRWSWAEMLLHEQTVRGKAWFPPAALLAGYEWAERQSACGLYHFRHLAVLVKSSSPLLKMRILILVSSNQVRIWFLLLQPLTFHRKVTPHTLLSSKAFQSSGKQPTSPPSLRQRIFAALLNFSFSVSLPSLYLTTSETRPHKTVSSSNPTDIFFTIITILRALCAHL